MLGRLMRRGIRKEVAWSFNGEIYRDDAPWRKPRC
jgi:hypothetical protein